MGKDEGQQVYDDDVRIASAKLTGAVHATLEVIDEMAIGDMNTWREHLADRVDAFMHHVGKYVLLRHRAGSIKTTAGEDLSPT